MTLFIDRAGDEDVVFGDLFTVSGQDGGLGEDNIADPTVLQVAYAETAGKPATADRLSTLVNTNLGKPIVITALPGGIDPHSGLDVTGNGFTYIDSSGTSPVVRVVYDDAQCNAAGIFTFDTGGNQITTPSPVILYHELSHAFRAAPNPPTTLPNDEPPAETDENVMRGELGLCQRDINNHNGGCGAGSDCGGSTGNGCFIASAVTGSPDSAEVIRLNQLRDRVVRATHLGARLMDAIYREYYRFSPRIAIELRHDDAAREGVLALAVHPLIAWYSLAEAIALAPENTGAATREVLDSCPDNIDAAMVAAAMAAIRAGEVIPAGAPPILSYLAARARNVARLPFACWAILDPLARIWTSVAHDLDAEDEARLWLASAPLEALSPPDHDLLDIELALLAAGPLSRPGDRREMGGRLVVAWPEARQQLSRHDFLPNGALR
jgi:hypothetical protein